LTWWSALCASSYFTIRNGNSSLETSISNLTTVLDQRQSSKKAKHDCQSDTGDGIASFQKVTLPSISPTHRHFSARTTSCSLSLPRITSNSSIRRCIFIPTCTHAWRNVKTTRFHLLHPRACDACRRRVGDFPSCAAPLTSKILRTIAAAPNPRYRCYLDKRRGLLCAGRD
jgi:hypothetical protein